MKKIVAVRKESVAAKAITCTCGAALVVPFWNKALSATF
jgi:hypothetical protein